MRKRITAIAMAGCILASSYGMHAPQIVRAEWKDGQKNEWIKSDGTTARSEWLVIDGKEYCFTEDGKVARNGIYDTNRGSFRFLNDGSVLRNAWESGENGVAKTYWRKENGLRATGEWCQTTDGTFFFSSGGERLRREGINRYYSDRLWATDAEGRRLENYLYFSNGSPMYYFGKGGVQCMDQAVVHEGNTYYFDADGNCVKNWWGTVNGQKRWFGSDGKMTVSGYVRFGDEIFHFREDGSFYQPGWMKAGDGWIKDDGEKAADEWITVEPGKTVYFQANGKPRLREGIFQVQGVTFGTDFQGARVENREYVTRNDEVYSFGRNGKIMMNNFRWARLWNAFFEDDTSIYKTFPSGRYGFGTDGKMVKNRWLQKQGRHYWFNHQGLMVKGGVFRTDRGDRMFWRSGALVRKHWVDDRYYLDDGALAAGGVFRVDGKMYYFDSDGRRVASSEDSGRYQAENGKVYYIKSDGTAAANEAVSHSDSRRNTVQWYKRDGSMAKNETLSGKNTKVKFDENGNVISVTGTGAGWKGGTFHNGIFKQGDGVFSWNGVKYGIRNEKMAKGKVRFGRDEYFFDQKTGKMIHGWVGTSHDAYYDPKTGKRHYGWLSVGADRYYLTKDSDVISEDGCLTIGGKGYFFGPDRKLKTGWIRTDRSTYFADNETGVLKTGRITRYGKNYYFDPGTYQAVKGIQTIDGKMYYMNDDGEMQYGVLTVGSTMYFADRKTGELRTGRIRDGKYTYYCDPHTRKMAKGFRRIGKKAYTFNSKGKMQHGLRVYGGKTYYADLKTGELVKGWKTVAVKKGNNPGSVQEKVFYFKSSDYSAPRGIAALGGKHYVFGEDGALSKGFQTISGRSYYSDPKTGEVTAGPVKEGGVLKAYIHPKTLRPVSGVRTIGRKRYVFNRKGELRTGWSVISGKRYYSDRKTGEVRKGWMTIGEKKYFFDRKTGEQWTKTGNVTLEGKNYVVDKDFSFRQP